MFMSEYPSSLTEILIRKKKIHKLILFWILKYEGNEISFKRDLWIFKENIVNFRLLINTYLYIC